MSNWTASETKSMTDLQCQVTAYTTSISLTLQRLNADRDKLRFRSILLLKTAKNLRTLYDEYEGETIAIEQLSRMIDAHIDVANDITHIVNRFNDSIARIASGFAEATSLTHGRPKERYLSYIYQDAAASHEHVQRTRDEYQQVYVRLSEQAARWI